MEYCNEVESTCNKAGATIFTIRIKSFNPQNHPMCRSCLILSLEMKKLRHCRAKYITQGHSTNKSQTRNNMAPGPGF